MAAVTKQKSNPQMPRSFLQKHGAVSLGLLLILGFNLALRWRLAEMPLERDEGEYAYAGQLLLQGIPPYQLAYNMKFPGTYFAYAALMAMFGESTRGIHLGLALVTSLTTILVFSIGNKLFRRGGGLVAAASCVLLSATPAAFGLAGHATHFIALLATAGTLVLLWADEKPTIARWGGAGFLFGAAILMKQHAVIFAGLGLSWVAWRNWPTKKSATTTAMLRNSLAAYSLGCITPLLITGIGLAACGVWKSFTFWTVQYATQYAAAVAIQTAWAGFLNGFGPVFDSTWPLWILGLIGLAAGLLSRERRRVSLAILLFLGGMLAACPGFHFRGHYFLAAIPGLALLIAATVMAALDRIKETPARGVIIGLFCVALTTVAWTNREIWFALPPDQVARRIYSLNPFLEAPKVADYLREHTSAEERIAVIGSEPEIYFHARRPSASGYIYMYALTEPLPLAQKMRDEFAHEIEAAKPRYVVFVDIITSWTSLTQADTSILTWWNDFAKQYEAVGAVKLTADHPSEYYWDETVVRSLDLTECHLIVYRRKSTE
jgi:hypothetical protein